MINIVIGFFLGLLCVILPYFITTMVMENTRRKMNNEEKNDDVIYVVETLERIQNFNELTHQVETETVRTVHLYTKNKEYAIKCAKLYSTKFENVYVYEVKTEQYPNNGEIRKEIAYYKKNF
jgi:hypothetical protein